MNAERNGFGKRRAKMRHRQALFIKRVARFMDHAADRLHKFRAAVARRDTRVERVKTGAERVRAGVQSAGVEIVADLFCDPNTKCFLFLDVKISGQCIARNLGLRVLDPDKKGREKSL